MVAKSIQDLKGRGADINLFEFAILFTVSVVFTTIVIFFWYTVLGFFVSGGVGSYIIPYFSYLYAEGKFKVPLIGDIAKKGSYMISEKPGNIVTEGGSGSSCGSNHELVKSWHEIYLEVIKILINIISSLVFAAKPARGMANLFVIPQKLEKK